MNTIAALTRSDPKRAEEAVEDLADLFRATLRDSHSPLRLKEELELTRIYQRIEALRLGSRLEVRWDVAALPMRAFVPGPHGAAAARERDLSRHRAARARRHGVGLGQRRRRRGRDRRQQSRCAGRPGAASNARGNRLALDNIRQRLDLAYGGRGSLTVEQEPDRYQVTVRFPYTE